MSARVRDRCSPPDAPTRMGPQGVRMGVGGWSRSEGEGGIGLARVPRPSLQQAAYIALLLISLQGLWTDAVGLAGALELRTPGLLDTSIDGLMFVGSAALLRQTLARVEYEALDGLDAGSCARHAPAAAPPLASIEA